MTNCQFRIGKNFTLPHIGKVKRTVNFGRSVTTKILVKLTIARTRYFWKFWFMFSKFLFKDEDRGNVISFDDFISLFIMFWEKHSNFSGSIWHTFKIRIKIILFYFYIILIELLSSKKQNIQFHLKESIMVYK